MKKILAILMAATLMLTGLAGCKSDEEKAREQKRALQQKLETEIQGYWIQSDALGLFAFNDNEYLLFTEDKEATGTFSFDGDTIMLFTTEDSSDHVSYTVEIEDDILYLKSDTGTISWQRVSEDDVREAFDL